MIRHIPSLVPSAPIAPMDMTPTMAARGELLGLDYRQIHQEFYGIGHVWGPVTHHIPSLVPLVRIVPIGVYRLVSDDP